MIPEVKRPLWSVFLPATLPSRIHALAWHAPMIMFGLASTAILIRQSYYRNHLADEDAMTHDRISRRAYVALPDGRMALIYPVIDTQVTLTRTVMSFVDAINPLP